MHADIVVFGGGAMGGLFGARLAHSGVATAIVDSDQELVDAINQDGITLISPDEEQTVRLAATTAAESLSPPDAVLFFVKCRHTEAAARSARPLLAGGAWAVTLQNGWGNADVLARAYGNERVVVGVTYSSATTVRKGVVRTSGPARTIVGSLAGRPPAADQVAEVLSRAGFPVERPADVLSEVWKKLVLNAATLPTAALTGLNAGALARDRDMRWLVDAAAAEAVAVGRAQGFDVDLEERLQEIHSVLARAGSGKGSMLQDVEAGRPTEIDVISGAVLARARELEVPAPVTRSLFALIAGLETARGQR